MKKTLKISVGVVLFLIISVIIGINFLFKPVIENRIRAAGFPNATVGKAHLGLSGTTLTNVQLDDAGDRIDEIRIYALASDIFAYRVGKVEVSGVNIRWPMALPPSGAASTGSLNLFTKEIVLDKSTVTFTTPYGDFPLQLDGVLTDNGNEYQVAGTAAGQADFGHVTGKLSVKIDKASRVAKAHYELGEDARFKTPDVELRRISGWLSADVTPGSALPLLNGELAIGGLKAYGVPMEATTLKVLSEPKKIQALAQGAVINDSGSINADFLYDQTDAAVDKITLKVDAGLKHLDALEVVDMAGQGSLLLDMKGERAKSSDWSDMSQWKTLSGSAGMDMEKLSLPGLINKAEALAILRVSLDPANGNITATAADGPITFSGKVRALGNRPLFINVPANPASPPKAVWDKQQKTLTTDIAGADIAALDFMAKGISTHVTAYLGAAPVMDGKIGIDELRHNVSLPYFMPVKVAVNLTPMDSLKSGTGFSGDVMEKNGHFSAKIDGKYDSATQGGNIALSMRPTTFTQNVTPVALSFPLTQTYLQDGFGTMGLSAALAWTKGKNGFVTTSGGQLYLKDFTCTIRDNVFTDVSTVLNLDSVMPPVLKHQTIAVGALNVGLPLTEGIVEASLDANRVFTLHKAEWNAAGGKISSSAFTMPLDTMTTNVTLTATKLNLQDLFQIAPLDGLSAQGSVNGTLPLSIQNGAFMLTNGVLQTTGPGVIKYNPTKVPSFLQNPSSQQIIDLKSALTSFEFNSLKMTVDGELGKTQKISLQISGKNPLFYSGHPVNFNLNVEGPIENIIRYNPGSNRIPDGIRKQLEDYEAKHGKG
ncbi:MAG: YdbH domain-containing protein [Micavibrio sp.]|nr:YdbH domain-containing protein [Micavibrio sp.]